MEKFAFRGLRADVKLSATDSVTIVGALVLIAGLIALSQMLSGIFVHHYVIDLNIFGLVAGPALLIGRGPGYWTALIILTADAIIYFAGVTVAIFVGWMKLPGNAPPWGIPETGITIILVTTTLVSLWAVRALRSREVRRMFGA